MLDGITFYVLSVTAIWKEKMMLKGINNNSGMVFIIVTAMIIVMSVIVVGMVSRNFSSALSGEEQKWHIEAEQIATAAFWNAYQQLNNGDTPVDHSIVQNGKTFAVDYTITPGGPSGSTVVVSITY